MSISGEEARTRALEKIGELRKITDELSAIMEEIPLPTAEEFRAMRSREIPWTLEAYIAAVIRNADFYVDEARVILNDYGSETNESLAERWKEGYPFCPKIERSLRYLVEHRSGEQIPPSLFEKYSLNPHAAIETLVRALFEKGRSYVQ
jgi:hypothetical protein